MEKALWKPLKTLFRTTHATQHHISEASLVEDAFSEAYSGSLITWHTSSTMISSSTSAAWGGGRECHRPHDSSILSECWLFAEH